MKKCCVIADFLSDGNKRQMTECAAECGFDIFFFENADEASGKLSDAEVLYSGGDASILNEADSLKWCHTAFAGVDPYVASGVLDSGDIILTNSSGAYGRAISEHIIMVTLLLLRRMPEYNKVIARHGWERDLSIRSIAGSSIVIIGTGDIGRNAAERFRALGAGHITGFNRSGRRADGFDEVMSLDMLDGFLKNRDRSGDMDVLLLCVPGTAGSRGLLSADRIAALPEKTLVINVGRGATIDQKALTDALYERKIAGAALDVMYPEPLPEDHPLWEAPNCIITPHISGDMSLPYTVDMTVGFFCENMRRYAAGEKLMKQIEIDKGY